MANKDIEKLVSVIIPARNIDYLLELCIKEIRELYPNVYIVIVLDEEDKKQKEFGGNIRFLTSKNPNMSAKRNLGVKNTDTKYIAFIDSDAYPNENWLENAINFLENNDEYFAVTGRQFNAHDDNLEQKCLRLVRFNRLFSYSKWRIITDPNAEICDCTCLATSNAILNKSHYLNLGGINEKIYLAEDNEFSERAIKNNYKIKFVPNVSVYHRECKTLPFLKKKYCMSYYYINSLIKGKPVRTIIQSIFQLFPLLGVIIYTGLYIAKPNSIYLLILQILLLILFINEAIGESKKLEHNKIKAFFIILFTFYMFCFAWILGSLFGFLNVPIKNIKNYYKSY